MTISRTARMAALASVALVFACEQEPPPPTVPPEDVAALSRDEVNQWVEQLVTNNQSLRESLRVAQRDLSEAETAVERVEDLEEELDSVRRQLVERSPDDGLKARVATLEAQLDEQRDENSALSQDLDDRVARIAELNDRIDELDASLDAAREARRNEASPRDTELRRARTRIADLEAEVADLEADLASARRAARRDLGRIPDATAEPPREREPFVGGAVTEAPEIDRPDDRAAPSAPAPEREPEPAPVEIVEARLISMVQPKYPRRANERGVEAECVVVFNVSAGGRTTAIRPTCRASRYISEFNQELEDAVREWRYTPRTENGERVTQWDLNEEVTFALED